MNVKNEILRILAHHISLETYQVFLFGSRASGKAKKWSDYDIGIKGQQKLSYSTLSKIESNLEESDIPYQVDIIDLNRVSEKFLELALKNKQLWTT